MTTLAIVAFITTFLILLSSLLAIDSKYGRKIAQRVANVYQVIGAILLVAAFI